MATSPVPFRALGRNGPQVSALGFGLMVLSSAYGAIPADEERFAILDRACELGLRFWDSADLYADSEVLVGKWFRRTGKRDQIFLATKFGFVNTGSLTNLKVDSSGEYAKKACEKSLKDLGTDYIDLYYVHHVAYETPIEETMRALVDLQKAGKIRHIGLSNVDATTIRRAQKVAPVAAVQIEYSPFVLDIEHDGILAICRELGIAVVCYSPLGRGLLTSTFAKNEPVTDQKDLRQHFIPRFMKDNRDKNVEIVNDFKALADKKGVTTSQLALAWLLKQGDDIIPIPGTKNIKYIEENRAALDVELTDEEVAEVRRFVESAELAGPRLMPEHKERFSNHTREE